LDVKRLLPGVKPGLFLAEWLGLRVDHRFLMPMTLHKSLQNLPRLSGMILAGLAVVLVVLWAGVIWGLQSLHQEAIRNQIQESSNISRVLQEQTTRVLAIVDKVTLRANDNTASARRSEDALKQVDVVRLANESGFFPEILSQLSIVDAQGRFLFSNLDPKGEKSGGVDLSEREHIKVHLNSDLAPATAKRVNANGLFIGKPVLGKVSKLWTIQVSRKLVDASGRVVGVVVASVNPVYFEQVYKDVHLGSTGNIALVGDDDIVRAEVIGGQSHGMGDSLVLAQPDPDEVTTADQTSFIRTDAAGTRHVVVSQRIAEYPLRLMISTSANWALTNWYETRTITLVLMALLSLGAVAASVFFLRVLRQKEAQSEEIRAQNQRQEMTMDAMQDGVLLFDNQGLLVKANPMALELLGKRQDAVLGERIEALFPGEQHQHRMDDWFAFGYQELMRYLALRIKQAAGAAPAIPVPLLKVGPDGHVLWATLTACELLGLDPESPQPDALASETVSQLLQVQAEQRAHAGPQSMDTHTVEVDWRSGDLHTLRLPTLLLPEMGTDSSAVFWIIPDFDALSAYAIRTLHNLEWLILRSEDEAIIPVLLTASPLLDPYSRLTGAVLTMKDVRDVKAQEAENLRMVKKMEQSQKLDALGQLAAGVAHDFNNLLGMIQSHAELVEMKIGTDSPAQKNLHAISQAITRAHNIVLTLNSLGRDAKSDSESTDPNNALFELFPLLHETQSLLQASMKGISISFENVDNVPDTLLLRGESGKLQQVLVNLCVNASHAIGEQRQGRITIETRCTKDGFVLVDVVDNGSGIPADILSRIFEPFFTTKVVGKGTGLGLAMVHSIVTKMNGSIDCQSEVGVGTRFSIKLPFESHRSY
jgi:signal transduction histidine kinase/PAS domain-containing protein